MKTNLSVLCVILLISVSVSIHLRHQQTPYDAELYEKELQEKQDQLQKDLNAIKQLYE